MTFNLSRSIALLIIYLASAMVAYALPSDDTEMRTYSISCLGGKGYKLRHWPARESRGTLGAFLEQSDEDVVALEIQRRYFGKRGVDDEGTEIIGLNLSGRIGDGKIFSPSPAHAKFAVSDSSGRVINNWKVHAPLSRISVSRLIDGSFLLTGVISVVNAELPGQDKSIIKIACLVPV